jgi:hypothetical protein
MVGRDEGGLGPSALSPPIASDAVQPLRARLQCHQVPHRRVRQRRPRIYGDFKYLVLACAFANAEWQFASYCCIGTGQGSQSPVTDVPESRWMHASVLK